MCHHLLRARVCACIMAGMRANGVNGQASFDGATLTISRKGFFGWATQGKGEKSIPLAAIGSVQFQPPTMTGDGVWSVSVLGEVQSSRSGGRGYNGKARAAMGDENSIVVRPGQGAAFKALGAAIAEAKASALAPAPAPAMAGPGGPSGDVAAQLRNLGSLHHRGAIDAATFIRELHTLLPRL